MHWFLGIQLSSLYDEHIAADTDTLEKTVKDLDIDFGTTELNSIQNAGDSTAGQTQWMDYDLLFDSTWNEPTESVWVHYRYNYKNYNMLNIW